MDYIEYPRALQTDGSFLLQGDGVGRLLFTNSISDADFLQWLRDPASRTTVLAEVKYAYQSAGVPAESTLRLADRSYTDEASNPPQPYLAVIEGAPVFQRSLDVQKLGGRGTASIGSITLANADGGMDVALGYIMDGRDVSFYIGDPTWERSQFRLLGIGSVATARADNDRQLTLSLRDKSLLLDTTIIGDAMTVGANVGKPKPVLFGQVYNLDLTPYLYDTAGPSYYFNNYAQDASLAFANVLVRDAGVSLVKAGFSGTNAAITANAGTDLITRTAHGLVVDDVVRFSGSDPFAGLVQLQQYWVIASGLTANDFKVSLTRGGAAVDITGTTFSGTLLVSARRYYVDAAAASLTLSAAPTGRVTADILSQGTSGDAAIQYVPHAGFRYILDTWTRLSSANRNTDSFASLVSSQQAAGTRWGKAVLDRTNVMDILDEIAVLTSSWYAWDNTGLLKVGKLDLANLDSVTAIDSIGEGDLHGDPTLENLTLPFGRLILDANRNVVTQTDGLNTAVSAADRSLWAQEFQTRVKSTDPAGLQYLNDWVVYHKTAIDSAPLPTAYTGNGAQALCDERNALFAPFTSVLSCTVGIDKYALSPGDCVSVSYPRYSLSAGKNFRVASVRISPGDKQVSLVLVRRTIPNWDALGVGIVVPAVPTIGTAVAKNTKATVAFTAPTVNGGSTITGYTATSSPGGFTGTGTASPITVTGLANGTPYTFTVKATNAAGQSLASAASNSITPATSVPDAPTGISAAAATSTTATVAFTAPADNGGSAVLDYTATSSPGGLTSSASGTSPCTVTGLTTGVDYTFTVKARNAIGQGAASDASNSVRCGNRTVALTIASNYQNEYNIFAAAGYPSDAVNVTLTINSGVDVFVDPGRNYGIALDTGSGWVTGSTITIINNGSILGKGGIGGMGSGGMGGAGTAGQPAISLSWNVTIDNTGGNIFGGGGGGGSGSLAGASQSGGGGAGYGQRSGFEADYGHRTTGGYGGTNAGTGGATASAGVDGYAINGSYIAGGAAGKSILLNGKTVTWLGGNNGTQVKGDVS